jgi:putative sporulation protein YtxC
MNDKEHAVESLHQEMVKKLFQIQNISTHLKLDVGKYPWHSAIYGSCATTLHAKTERQVFKCLSQIIADFIVDQQENQLLKNLITHQIQSVQPYEIDRIYEITVKLLHKLDEESTQSGVTYHVRKHYITKQTEEYFQDQKTLVIEGYIFFRLRDYIDELTEIIEYAIEEFKMDQQYQEFISLLKYFVYIQEPRISAVHLLHKADQQFELFDDQLQLLQNAKKKDYVKLDMIDNHLNFEDMVVSTLISAKPAVVYIHATHLDFPLIHTITQIFENRVKFCNHCHICHHLSNESQQKDHFSP